MSRYKCWSCKNEHGTDNVEAVCVQCFADLKQKLELADAANAELREWGGECELCECKPGVMLPVICGECQRKPWDRVKELEAENKKLRADAAEMRQALGACRRAIYEIEGGDRWPVDWSSDKMHAHIQAAKGALRKARFAIEEWVKASPGYKRAALKELEGPKHG